MASLFIGFKSSRVGYKIFSLLWCITNYEFESGNFLGSFYKVTVCYIKLSIDQLCSAIVDMVAI